MNGAEMIGDAGFDVVEMAHTDEAIAILEAPCRSRGLYRAPNAGSDGWAEARQVHWRPAATGQDHRDLWLRQCRVKTICPEGSRFLTKPYRSAQAP
jgi:hypothetical protein